MRVVGIPLLLSMLQRLDFPHKLGFCEKLFGAALDRKGVCRHSPVDRLRQIREPTFSRLGIAFPPGRQCRGRFGRQHRTNAPLSCQWTPRGRVLAFEPGSTACDWLRDCLRQNPGLPVEVIPYALGAARAPASLRLVGPETSHGAQNCVWTGSGEPIEVVRLDDELEKRGIHRVRLWKLDVEGYEFRALNGLNPTGPAFRVGVTDCYSRLFATALSNGRKPRQGPIFAGRE